MLRLLIAVPLAASLVGSPIPAQSRTPIAIAGVWQVIEARDGYGKDITDPDERTMYIFTARHFSILWSELNRPELTGTLSDSAKVAMWQDFGAQAGSYEVSRDTLVLHTDIAKSPSAMKGGAFQKFHLTLAGAVLWLNLVADKSGPLQNQERIGLRRIE
jgi:hypothetical protein